MNYLRFVLVGCVVLFFASLNFAQDKSVPKEVLKKYVGNYVTDSGVVMKITLEDDKLFRLVRETRQQLYPKSETEFWVGERELLGTFKLDEHGNVSKIVFVLGQQTVVATRMTAENKRKSITLKPELLERYAGEYEASMGIIVITKEGNRFLPR